MTPCARACRHVDCAMERGDVLPAPVTRSWSLINESWVEYVPRPEAQARHDALTRAVEAAEALDAEIAQADALAAVERVTCQVGSTKAPGSDSQDS